MLHSYLSSRKCLSLTDNKRFAGAATVAKLRNVSGNKTQNCAEIIMNQNTKYILPSIIAFLVAISFILFVFISNYRNNVDELLKTSLSESGFIIFLTSFLSIPGFILHYRYSIHNRKKTITFKKNYLEITIADKTNDILYTDISVVEKHSIGWKTRNPWSDYSYVKIILNNGEKIYYNCLTNIKNSENNLFKIDRVKVYDLEGIFPWY